jgi:dehydrogenase/reductase SDR family protein 4
LQEYGRLDILVNNAVVNPTYGPLLETAEKAIDKILQVNIKAGVLLAQTAARHMSSGAAIVFVTSIIAYEPSPPLAMYGISKTALLGVVKAMARELGPRGIRVNGLAPGIVATKFSEALVSSEEQRRDQVCNILLAKTAGTSFLLSFLLSCCEDTQ